MLVLYQGGLNVDRMVMCHQRFKFTNHVLEWKTQKVYPVLERFLKQNYVYRIVSETKSIFMLYSINQMFLPFHSSFTMFVQKSFKFSITAISLRYDICSAFQN